MDNNDLGRVADGDQALVNHAPADHVPSGFDPSRWTVAKCLQIVREVRDDFRSEGYAVPQPIASFSERFACDQVAEAIEREFGMGTIEQRKLLSLPTPFEEYAASGIEAGTGETADAGSTAERQEPVPSGDAQA